MEDLIKKRKKVLQKENQERGDRLTRLSGLMDSIRPETFIQTTTNIEHKLVTTGSFNLSQTSMAIPNTSELYLGITAILKEDPNLVDIVTTKLYLGGVGMEPLNIKLQSHIEKIAPSHDFIMSEIAYYFSKYDVKLAFSRKLVEGKEYSLKLEVE